MPKKPNEARDPASSAVYRRILKPGLKIYSRSALGGQSPIIKVHDGDIILFQTTTYPEGKEGQAEHAHQYSDFARVLGLAVADGCGAHYTAVEHHGTSERKPWLAVVCLSTNAQFGFIRFIEQHEVVYSMSYKSCFFRWFVSGECGFDQLDMVLRSINYGSFNERAIVEGNLVDAPDAKMWPDRGCYCHRSFIPGIWVPQAIRDFELWLTAYGALDENGVPKSTVRFSQLAPMFLRQYRHLAGERHIVEGHGENLDRHFARKPRDVESGTTPGLAPSEDVGT